MRFCLSALTPLECVCNGFAELSRFADRQFYEDWWNSTNWDQFARKVSVWSTSNS
jgi:hypothetical protein